MKKLFVFSSSLAVVLLVGFACKKSTTTTPSTTTSTSSTTGTTSSTTGAAIAPSNTVTTNFTVDGTAANVPTETANTQLGNYYVSAFDNSGTPNIQLTFPGTTTPAAGNYAITTANPTGNHCNFLLNGASSAASGVVTVVGVDVYFSNVICGTHTVTGNIKY